ncbi:LamG-like jellyroll fold domain-containing protein [Klebsiella pneumoniae]|uniref:LamG-like jellyroll fold domain-containing protein n=1 Tax=Klebsiella pneumoniae TaxID=573 RepID=UPI000A496CCF|nr:LamG-like jellyroll fold domain-containing protein [Klebsiella pneumoniae]
MGEISVKTGNNARNGGKNSLNRLIRCVCGKKIGPDPRNFNQRVSLGRNDLLIRTFLNSDGVITNWEKQYFEPVKSPLAAIANPIVAFDLLTPVDNSRHGFSVQQGVQILKGYGLEFPGSAGSQTTFAKSGLSGLSFLTAFRLSAVDVFQYVLDCRDLTPGTGHGYAITFNPAGQRLELRVGWPDGSQGIYFQEGKTIVAGQWYVACGVISPNRNHKLTLSDGTAIAASPAGYLLNVAGNKLMLGASAAGSSMMKGDLAFFGAWEKEFTAGDTLTAVALGKNIMALRGQAV